MPPAKKKPGPASRTNATRAAAAVFRCSYCGKVCLTKSDLANHKRDDHADQITHLTESSVAGAPAAVHEDFAVPENPQLPGRRQRGRPRRESPDPDPGDSGSGGDDGENDPPSPPPPPSPKKRGKKQGRNKSPLPIGKKKKVKGVDGVERMEFERGERTSGG